MLTYEEMGKLPADRSVIPNSCESFAESAFYVAEAATRHMNKFFEEVGITELAIFESTGSVVVYEGEKMKGFVEGLGKVWDNIWKAIKGAFEKLINFIHEKQKEAALKVVDKVSESDVEKIDDKKFEKTLGKFTYIQYKYNEVKKEIESNFTGSTTSMPNLFDLSDEEARKQSADYVKEVNGKIYGGSDVTTLEALNEAVKKACTSEGKALTKEYLKSNLNSMKDTTKDLLNSAKSNYSKMKRTIDDNKRKLRALKDKDMDVVRAEQRCQVARTMAYNSAIFATYDVAKLALKQNMSVLKMVGALAKSKPATEEKKDEVNQESANFIEEAFQW